MQAVVLGAGDSEQVLLFRQSKGIGLCQCLSQVFGEITKASEAHVEHQDILGEMATQSPRFFSVARMEERLSTLVNICRSMPLASSLLRETHEHHGSTGPSRIRGEIAENLHGRFQVAQRLEWARADQLQRSFRHECAAKQGGDFSDCRGFERQHEILVRKFQSPQPASK